MRNKEVLHLNYLHANNTILNTYTKCVEAQSRDDVHVYMNNFVKNGVFIDNPTLKQKTEKFIEEKIVTKNWQEKYIENIVNL